MNSLEQAKTKWCPHARIWDGSASSVGMAAAGINRSRDKDEIFSSRQCCIGDECMSWRWRSSKDEVETVERKVWPIDVITSDAGGMQDQADTIRMPYCYGCAYPPAGVVSPPLYVFDGSCSIHEKTKKWAKENWSNPPSPGDGFELFEIGFDEGLGLPYAIFVNQKLDSERFGYCGLAGPWNGGDK